MCCSVFLTSMRNVKRSVVTCQIKNIFDIFLYFRYGFRSISIFLFCWIFRAAACVRSAWRARSPRITSDFATFVVYCLFHILSADARFYLVNKYLYNGVSSSSLFVFPVVRTQLLPFSIDSSALSVFLLSHSFSIARPLIPSYHPPLPSFFDFGIENRMRSCVGTTAKPESNEMLPKIFLAFGTSISINTQATKETS